MDATTSKLRHIVLFGFKPHVKPADIDGVVDRFAALQTLVPGIASFEWGVNVSPEGLANGHTHCFQLTFGTEAARDAYLPHPDHVAFADGLAELVAHVTVVDYWTS